MAQYRDVIPSKDGWLHELARADIHPEAERLLQLGKAFDPKQLVEESSVQFLSDLRDYFTEYSRVFNGYSENGSRFQEVKIYSIAQTPADFMVFRNQVKLVIAHAAHGSIQIGFDHHDRGSYSLEKRNDHSSWGKVEELVAQVGAFRNVYWSYQGERIDAESVAKFYFTEFVRVSRDQKQSKLGNEMLVEQIKTLLKQKGLDL